MRFFRGNRIFEALNTYKDQKNAVYYDKTQPANFRGNPIFQATKTQVVEKKWWSDA